MINGMSKKRIIKKMGTIPRNCALRSADFAQQVEGAIVFQRSLIFFQEGGKVIDFAKTE